MKKEQTFYVHNAFCASGKKKPSSVAMSEYLKWRAFIDFINSKRRDNQDTLSGTDIGSWYGLKDGVCDSLGSAPYNNDEIVELDDVINHFNIEYPDADDFVSLWNNIVARVDVAVLITCRYSECIDQYAYLHELVDIDEDFGGGTALISECSTTNNRWFVTDERSTFNLVWSEYNNDYICTDDDYAYQGIITRGGDYGWFCSEDYVYTEDTRRYFANDEIAECNGCSCDDDGYWYENRRRRGVYNASYHDLDRKFRCDLSETPFRVGFEVEKEDLDAVSIEFYDLYEDTDWIKENDGSLDGCTGYELISPTFDLFSPDLENDIKQHIDLQTLINANFSAKCGGHINLSARDYKPSQLFEGISGFFPLLYAMYESRLGINFSKAKKKHEYYREDKYSAVYLKDQLVELRIFPAVRSVANLIWRRDLVRIMCKNINADEVAVLKMMATTSSELYKHLRKIYSQEQIITKIGMFITYADLYCNKKIQPPKNLDNLKKKKDRYPDANDSSDQLGA